MGNNDDVEDFWDRARRQQQKDEGIYPGKGPHQGYGSGNGKGGGCMLMPIIMFLTIYKWGIHAVGRRNRS
jgi:hypothetical protein